MMKKEFYDQAEIEIIRLTAVDVLVDSTVDDDDDDELPFVPSNN